MRQRTIATATILFFFLLGGACASAQVSEKFLFPGKKRKTQEKQEQPVRQEPYRDSTAASQSSFTVTENAPVLDEEEDDDAFFSGGSDVVNLALILPLGASSDKPSSNFLEMYAGALLALRDLGNAGININLQTFDSAQNPKPEVDYESFDVILGPVSYNDIADALESCGRKLLVSPLDPKAAQFSENEGNVIQTPVPWAEQIDELVDWVAEELLPMEEVILLGDGAAPKEGSRCEYLISRLQDKRIRYRNIKSASELELHGFAKYKVLIASDDEAFITRAVKGLGIASEQGAGITLYSTSTVRNCVGPDILDLYNLNTRLTAAYFIDYDSPKVKDFVLSYRALYSSEPSSFAFQGYDAAKYFVTAFSQYGRRWYRKLPLYRARGLQADFQFERGVADGKVNTAVRRVVYNKDLSTTLL